MHILAKAQASTCHPYLSISIIHILLSIIIISIIKMCGLEPSEEASNEGKYLEAD